MNRLAVKPAVFAIAGSCPPGVFVPMKDVLLGLAFVALVFTPAIVASCSRGKSEGKDV